MRNLLVVVDNSQESASALQLACRFEANVRIHPIHISPAPEHDLAIGAGWARISWAKETMLNAQKEAKELITSQGRTCPVIEEPIVGSGDAIRTIADHFVKGHFDMLIIGAPFRGLDPLALARQFKDAVKKSSKDIPLLVVCHHGTITRTLALTDGGDASAKALGFINRISPLLSETISLIGINDKKHSPGITENLILERGLAILKEKDIDAEGYTAEDLGSDGVKTQISKADLLVCPLASDICAYLYKTHGSGLDSVLFYLDRN